MLAGEPRLIGADGAAGPLQAHTLAVNDAAICFIEAARGRGDEFGPFAWRHEIYHPAIALLRSNPRLSRAPRVSISICLLEDLQAKGPFAPIFRDFRSPEKPIDWLGG